jgi:hypothetical protein
MLPYVGHRVKPSIKKGGIVGKLLPKPGVIGNKKRKRISNGNMRIISGSHFEQYLGRSSATHPHAYGIHPLVHI